MDIQIKNYADNKNLKELKYIFVDALDVDPTFEGYKEEYKYCKSIPGLLEQHQELTPFKKDKNCWDENYWTNLKTDLIKNFSDTRMMHMKEVAEIFLAEKIKRLQVERDNQSITNNKKQSHNNNTKPTQKKSTKTTISQKEQEYLKFEAKKRSLEQHNQKVDSETNTQRAIKDDSSKKALGIALIVATVAAIITVVWIVAQK